MKVYIGAPIDTSLADPGDAFEELAEWVVEAFGNSCVIYNPFSAFRNAGKSDILKDLEFVIDLNIAALDASDVAVFVWNGEPSFGVPVEIKYATLQRKRVVVVNTTGAPLGLYLRAVNGQGLIAIVHSPTELKEYLALMHQTRTLSEDDGEIT